MRTVSPALGVGLSLLIVLGLNGAASAQLRNSGSSSGFNSSSSGSSSGTFTGSSGTFSGTSSSSSTGGFTGSAGGFGGGSGTGTGGGIGTSGSSGATINTANPLYRYDGNPLVAGLPTASNSNSSQYLRTFPETLSFGQPLYTNITSATGTGSTGRTGTSGSFGSTSGTATISGNGFSGANSLGIRRTPSYVAVLDFDHTPPAPSAIRTDLQNVISQSTRLPSRGNIRVTVDGDTVVLRGRVSNPRERRLAESLVRLTPGVHEVRNDLVVPGEKPPSNPAQGGP